MSKTLRVIALGLTALALTAGVAVADECSIIFTEGSQECYVTFPDCGEQCGCIRDVTNAWCQCLLITGQFDLDQFNSCQSTTSADYTRCLQGCRDGCEGGPREASLSPEAKLKEKERALLRDEPVEIPLPKAE